MWPIDLSLASKAQGRSYRKKHPREFAACFRNLDRIRQFLCENKRPNQIEVGFFKHEGGSVYRIAQTGVPNAQEIRLYVYFDEAVQVVYVLGIGDRSPQSQDITSYKKAVSKNFSEKAKK
jgi:hypothetical protein